MDYDGRDYKDLQNDKIAVYNFRGYTVLKFDKETKHLEFGEHANMCGFVNSDLELMSKFLGDCYKYTQGLLPDINHVEVN